MVRVCSRCGAPRTPNRHHKSKKSPDGLYAICKSCSKAKAAVLYHNNKDKILSRSRDWYENNKGRKAETGAAWITNNKERKATAKRAWLKNKPYMHAAWVAGRRARVKRATPKWVDTNKILETYVLAAELTSRTGILHHVDHITPITSKYVCGLHVHTNMQVITQKENDSKGNKSWPHMFKEILAKSPKV